VTSGSGGLGRGEVDPLLKWLAVTRSCQAVGVPLVGSGLVSWMLTVACGPLPVLAGVV
jgi:hypothetical protein